MSDFIPYLSKSLGDKSYSRFTETWRQRSTSGRSIDGGLHGQCAQFPTIKDDEIIRGKMRRKCSGIVCTCVYTFSMTICIDQHHLFDLFTLTDHPRDADKSNNNKLEKRFHSLSALQST